MEVSVIWTLMMDSGFWVGGLEVCVWQEMSGSVSYHAVWQQKTCLDEVSLASTYASNLACLFGDSGRFSNLDFSASELSAELNLAIGNILVSSSISPPNLEPRPGLPQKKAGGRRLVWDFIWLSYYDTSWPQRVVSRKVSRNGKEPETERVMIILKPLGRPRKLWILQNLWSFCILVKRWLHVTSYSSEKFK